MSLIDSKYLEPASRGRNGVHYYEKDGKPAGTWFPTHDKKRYCPDCKKWTYEHIGRNEAFNITLDKCLYCEKPLREEIVIVDNTRKPRIVP
jgi:hypothetical protein